MTPALQERLDADPEFARMYDEEDHFDQHIECVYEVRLGHEPHQRYQWRHEISNTLEEHTVAVCNGPTESIAQDIVKTTRDCTDLEAGAYWGLVLAPLN